MTPLPTPLPAVLKGPGVLHSSLALTGDPGVWRPLALGMGEGELPSAWVYGAVGRGGHKIARDGCPGLELHPASPLPQAYRLYI